jgi:hypothetical protein
VIFLVLAGLVAFWFVRRRVKTALSQQRPVNVLQDDEDGNEDQWHYLPQNYAPQPFLMPDPSNRGTSEPTSTQDDRPLSMSTVTTDVQSPLTPTSKTRSFPQIPPVNIIQHHDAGPSEDLSGQVEPETIELPPAYSNIRQLRRSLFLPNRRHSRQAAEDEP